MCCGNPPPLFATATPIAPGVLQLFACSAKRRGMHAATLSFMNRKRRNLKELFSRLTAKASEAAGSFWAFSAAVTLVLVWAITGPFFHFSEVWQLVINTSTTIITFLMVFIIQHAQNKETRALHLKLNELIAAVSGASNRLIDVEDLSDREVEVLYHRFQSLARTAAKLERGAKVSVEQAKRRGETNSSGDAVPVKPEARRRKQSKSNTEPH